jgi:hypothetical protein
MDGTATEKGAVGEWALLQTGGQHEENGRYRNRDGSSRRMDGTATERRARGEWTVLQPRREDKENGRYCSSGNRESLREDVPKCCSRPTAKQAAGLTVIAIVLPCSQRVASH